MIHEITDETFEAEVAKGDIPCVILFTAGWCNLCPEMESRFEALSQRMDEVKFCVVDTDKQKGLRIAFAVGVAPYIVMVRDGMKLPLFDQIISEEELEERIRYILDGGKPPIETPLRPIRWQK